MPTPEEGRIDPFDQSLDAQIETPNSSSPGHVLAEWMMSRAPELHGPGWFAMRGMETLDGIAEGVRRGREQAALEAAQSRVVNASSNAESSVGHQGPVGPPMDQTTYDSMLNRRN